MNNYLNDNFVLTALMSRALRLAEKGIGKVSPNPRVGAVIVSRDGSIIGQGYHKQFGASHAEVEALKSCNNADTRGASLITNLEPCCHYGKTPPCTESIIRAGISRVVIGVKDPNPRVNGNGIRILREAGVEVIDGVLEDQARYLNRGYLSMRLRNRSWCAAKIALSIDGRLADHIGTSKWITGEKARKLAHQLRSQYDAILVGGNTIRNDNPELTVRMTKGKNPSRVILAPRLRIDDNSQLVKTAAKSPIIQIIDNDTLVNKHIQPLTLPSTNGYIEPIAILTELSEIGLQSVLIEGGAGVLSSFLKAEVIDELFVGIAPTVIGNGISPFQHFTPVKWEDRPKFNLVNIKKLDEDIIITYSREQRLFSQEL